MPARTTRLAILPTYNERENIDRLLSELRQVDPELHLLVIDDASPDGTGDIVAGRAAHDPRIGLLRRSRKLGLGSAYVAGFAYAMAHDFSLGLTMDADFSHGPEAVPAIVRAAASGADLVLGSRYVAGGMVTGWGPGRRWLSRYANRFARFVLRLNPLDCTGGYRCYSRAVMLDLLQHSIRSTGYSAQIELLFQIQRRGGRIVEVPIHFRNRTAGRSKISSQEIYKALWTVLRLRLWPGRLG
jgi:glycosyltransferase involved in cell wall biosynthesis